MGYDLKPVDCTRKRGHVQIVADEIDFVLRVLNRSVPFCPDRSKDLVELMQPEFHLDGNNFVKTPCTCEAGLAHAFEHRHRLLDADRPWRVADRHMRGFQREQRDLTNRLWAIIRSQGRYPKTLFEKCKSYSGTKRVHYEKCAKEFEAHPLSMAERMRIHHGGSVKWGELSDRPRALMVQQVRAKGTEGVKPGEVLRLPILVEGVHRELEEDALHKLFHSNGWHYTASGMSLHKRARKIRAMIAPGDVVMSADWKSFDGSLGEIGNVERDEFLRAAERHSGRNDALRAVIATQKRAKIESGPFKAQVYGNRGSGTAGTSTGNKKVVLAALFYALGPAAKGKGAVKFFCDGDDTLIIIPEKWQGDRWYRSWVRRMTELGLETKIEQLIVDNTLAPAEPQVRFCRAGVIDTARGPFLCKVPSDAVKVVTNFRRHFRGPYFRDYCATLSVGLRDTYGDVPILSALHRLVATSGSVDKGLLEQSGIEYMIQKTTDHCVGDITMSHRLSFHRTWGVTPGLQIQCEQALTELSFKLRPMLEKARF